jgi:pimeloyl-ACP methyl ester carboxylesterase
MSDQTLNDAAPAQILFDEENLGAWWSACRNDDELSHLAAAATIGFDIVVADSGLRAAFRFRDGSLVAEEGPAAFSLTADLADWNRFFHLPPPPAYQNFFGMLMRVPSASVMGSELAMAQSAHLSRRVLEIGRAVANGVTTAELSRPVEQGVTASKKPSFIGGYVTVQVEGSPIDVYYEERGQGRDVLLLHTAGADGRQYHDLMGNDTLTAEHRLVTFDLPGHGRSDPFPHRVIGAYSLTTELYASTVLAVVDALGLSSPIVSGSSMGGEVCLELAYRASDTLGGVIACEASERVNGRNVAWAKHPLVNESLFVPEWVYGLMAPQSPERYRRKVWWGYSQGGFSTFAGDIDFYSGDWDGTDRIPLIDTAACPVVMMTGEYDYSCTPAMSEATAARIPGATFWPMPELGHFPMAENPHLFAVHFERALKEIER